jgi:hypothetical protein
MRKPLVEHVIVQGRTEESEGADRELRDRKQEQVLAGIETIRNLAARVAATAEPGHERGNNDRGGLDVGSRKQQQQPLPDDLVKKRAEAGDEED